MASVPSRGQARCGCETARLVQPNAAQCGATAAGTLDKFSFAVSLTGERRCPSKYLRLRRLFGHRLGEADPPSHARDARLSARGTNRFERAGLRRCVSEEGGEFHLARYLARRFKFPFEHQCSRVAPDVADWKFHRARERHGVSFALGTLYL